MATPWVEQGTCPFSGDRSYQLSYAALLSSLIGIAALPEIRIGSEKTGTCTTAGTTLRMWEVSPCLRTWQCRLSKGNSGPVRQHGN